MDGIQTCFRMDLKRKCFGSASGDTNGLRLFATEQDAIVAAHIVQGVFQL